ncbi:SUKH-3 domain-containing protein [Streptomyces sp. NPDC001339]|uniref:SUKH-3 domain-containing protein n=1 Tax=Streptomyces sp. NPDC001339 TaxID=3364563 RepID=UPI0036B7254B
MNATPDRAAVRKLQEDLSTEARFTAHPLDIEAACRKYTEEGYEVTPQLVEFLENYGELTVTWQFRNADVELSTTVESALDMPFRNVRICAKRIGRPVLPVGSAFVTEEGVLLAENGDIFLAGDAGIQRVDNGFENAVRALIASDWDKTFF